MEPITIPESLEENVHDDMIKINSAKVLENAYFFEDMLMDAVFRSG